MIPGYPYSKAMQDVFSIVPVFVSKTHYEAVCVFLGKVEELVPHLVEDLEALAPLVSQQVMTVVTQLYGDRSTSIWTIVRESIAPDCIALRHSLNAWADTYHLADDSKVTSLYMEIGLRAVLVYVSDPGATRCLSLVNVVQEVIEGSNEFDRIFPFVFAPARMIGLSNEYAERYEELWHRERQRIIASSLDEIGMPVPSEITGYAYPWHGCGWDPRMQTWSEFEREMNVAFKAYKESYRDRTLRQVEQWGFERAKEKRDLTHFEWLIRWQFYGWSQREIADHYELPDGGTLTESNIGKNIAATAELVFLPLRHK